MMRKWREYAQYTIYADDDNPEFKPELTVMIFILDYNKQVPTAQKERLSLEYMDELEQDNPVSKVVTFNVSAFIATRLLDEAAK